MKKKLTGILLSVMVGLFLASAAFARPDTNGDWQERLDNWFAGFSGDLDQAGQSFARIFLKVPDSERWD
jgi:hypothetical protein